MESARVMDQRFSQHLSSEGRPSVSLHRKLVEAKRVGQNGDQVLDLTGFMNDACVGRKKSYDLNGVKEHVMYNQNADHDFDSSTRSINSRQTQEWLEEAKRMVGFSPVRGRDSPSRLVGSPRFGTTQSRPSVSALDKRDPLSRSARRNRAMEGFSGEILTRTAIHTRNRSETNMDPPQGESSPASDIHRWLSKLSNNTAAFSPPTSPPPLPPRQSTHRKSRFQTDPDSPASHPIPTLLNHPASSPSKRNFKTAPHNGDGPTAQLLSPPKHLPESAHRRSPSSCSVPEAGVLSPPRNLVESAHRRSISSSTCRTDRILKKNNDIDTYDAQLKEVGFKDKELNLFLEEQRVRVLKLLRGEINGRAKVVLSGPSNSTSSMVAATCYAWLLENRMRAGKKEGAQNENNVEIVVPVMNTRRSKMWKQRQAAWLFHHAGLDAASLLFSDEVELETLMMAKQLSMVEVGVDVLKTSGEVGSSCTVLTDNYCEDAYALLQNLIVKKLLLAGILLDTKNLSNSPRLSMTRDAEAVQLLSVASGLNYRNTLYDQLTHDQGDDDFFEVLCRTYGKPPIDIKWGNGESGIRASEKLPSYEGTAASNDKKQNDASDARRKKVSPVSGKPTPSPAVTPLKAPAKVNSDASRGKNKNFFAKLFGFGSK